MNNQSLALADPPAAQEGSSRGNEALTVPRSCLPIRALLPRLLQVARLSTPAAFLALAACSSTPLPPERQWKVETYQQEAGGAGYGGQVMIDTTRTNATVVSINAADRSWVLKYPNGTITTYQAGPEVRKFDQIKVGDKVKATLVDEFALSLEKSGALSSVNTTNSTVAVPNGAMPGLRTVHILSFTAKVLAINLAEQQVNLQLADGRTKTVHVRPSVNLADFNPGDIVSARTIETTTLLVETP
jgi:hypothetical protein